MAGIFDFLRPQPVANTGGLLTGATQPGAANLGTNITNFFQQNPALISNLAANIGGAPNIRQGLAGAAAGYPAAQQADIQWQQQQAQKKAIQDFLANPENAKAYTPAQLNFIKALPPDLQVKYLGEAFPAAKTSVAVPAGGSLVDPSTGKVVYQGQQGSFVQGGPGDTGGTGGAPAGGGAWVRDVNGNLNWQGPQYLGPPQENAFDKTLGESQAKAAQAVTDAGDKAGADLQKANLIGQLMDQVQTGKLTPAIANVGAWLQSVGLDPGFFGIDPKTPANAQALSGLANAMILGKIGSASGGFPANNFSEQDRNFLLTTIPQLSQQPGASRMLLEVNKRLDQLAIKQANDWDNARAKGTTWQQFSHDWRTKLADQNVFADLIPAAENLASQPTGPKEGDQAVGPNGEKGVFHNGQWVDPVSGRPIR